MRAATSARLVALLLRAIADRAPLWSRMEKGVLRGVISQNTMCAGAFIDAHKI